MKENNNTPIDTNLHMTADVWNELVKMMDTSQLENFIENLDYIQDCLVSDEFVTNCVEDFGGADKVLLLLNTFKRMGNLFQTINIALKQRGGVA